MKQRIAPKNIRVPQRTSRSRRKPGRPATTAFNARDLLLDTASALLNERTSLDLSLSELARHSGLNSALVKYYFGNKDGLFLALLQRDAGLAMQELHDLLAKDLSPEAKLRRHIAAVIVTFHRSPYLNRLLHTMLNDGADQGSAAQIAEFFVKPFVALQTKLLHQGVKAGVFRKVEPMFFYLSVLGACDLMFNARFTLQAVFHTPRITKNLRRRYVDHVADMVLAGISR
jgi:TetR/AcrR family transcriptional regulator